MNARWAGAALLAALMLLGAAPVPKIQSMLARPKILCGRFDQSKQLVGLKKPVNSNGRFCVVADKGVLWRTLQPFANTLKVTRDEIIQLSGDRVAVRMDARQEPAVRMINSVLFALLAGDLEPLEKLFDIDGAAQDKSWSVKLKPRDPGLSKVISGIALDGGAYVKSIVISEASGDRTEIEFSAIQTGDGAMKPDEAALF
jgi:Outer membrane lipoprotein carrier protein LolA-like